MIEQYKSPDLDQPINVGVYGCTKAGKTRFLFQLLCGWQGQDRLLPQSLQALQFLDQTRAEIKKYGESMPTAAVTENILVGVRRGGKEKPWHFRFRDLRGELLADELPPDGRIVRNGAVAKQVVECDAFLFFFDPSCSEAPADVDRHHQRELKRASMFIEYVLHARGNRHLPIIFVLTHRDRWENDQFVREKAKRWANEVHSKLEEMYHSGLRRIHPKCIVDRNRVFIAVSSVGDAAATNERLERVVQELADLTADAAAHRRRMRRSAFPALAFLIAIALVSSFVVYLFSKAIPPPEPFESRIVENLDGLDQLLKSHPHGLSSSSDQAAKKINDHLRTLTQYLKQEGNGSPILSDEMRKRMQTTVDAAGKRVVEAAADGGASIARRTHVLALLLDGLPDLASASSDFAEAQRRFWKLERDHAVEELARVLKRHGQAESRPVDALDEVVGKLRENERRVGGRNVFGETSRQVLVEELRTTATFCGNKIRAGGYPCRLRVVSANAKKAGSNELYAIKLSSPGRNDWPEGAIALWVDKAMSLDIKVTVYWGPDCLHRHFHNIVLKIDGRTYYDDKLLSIRGGKDTLDPWRIDLTGDVPLDFSAVVEAVKPPKPMEPGIRSFQFRVEDVVNGEKTLELGNYGIRIGVAAESASESASSSFSTKKGSYQAELGLGSPVRVQLFVYEKARNDWGKIDENELTAEGGPLAAVGLPFYRGVKKSCNKNVRIKDMEMTLELTDLSNVPPLLWEAATRTMEPAQ